MIVGAISAAIDDLRKNPWLLDYCFAWFAHDDLTKGIYGDKEVARAKEWFLKHKIFVTSSFRMDAPVFPVVSVNLISSTEDAGTLADVNYDTTEEVEAEDLSLPTQIVSGPFTPQEYDSTTGLVTLPDGFTTDDVFAGQVLVDKATNIGYTINEVINSTSFKIDEDISANFINSYIAPIDSFYITQLESCLFRHTYSIKCFAQSEPIQTMYLHTLIRFILLRYKEVFLEARGFDRSTITSTGIYLAQDLLGVENTFGQDINLTGYCREYWPKIIGPAMQGIKIHRVDIIGGTATPDSMLNEIDEQGWGMEGDE